MPGRVVLLRAPLDFSKADSCRVAMARELCLGAPHAPRHAVPFRACLACGSHEHPVGLCPEPDGYDYARADWTLLAGLPERCVCGGIIQGECETCAGWAMPLARGLGRIAEGAILVGGWRTAS